MLYSFDILTSKHYKIACVNTNAQLVSFSPPCNERKLCHFLCLSPLQLYIRMKWPLALSQ